MTTARVRTIFTCQECGHESPKWLGRCPGCDAWNSYVEAPKAAPARGASRPRANGNAPQELAHVNGADAPRMPLAIDEFDRVLGGGIVPGSLSLVGGDPGIGKSTLLLQAASQISQAGGRVLYISAEESAQQLKMRATRLGVAGDRIHVLADTDLASALAQAETLSPALVIVDSIQTVFSPSAQQAPGSIAQLRQCAMELMRWAKESGVPVFVIGHVTKDGDIAGPRLLEHIVDVVLYLEGERFSAYRLLRAVKNRFGSIDEVGVFEMTATGLAGVENPSQAFIAERAAGGAGSAVVATLEGTRPLLLEVQALTSPSVTPAPRRTASGLDFNRMLIVCAVLSRRLNLPLGSHDVIANVVGGLRVTEPAADLALALAVASSHNDRPVPADLVVMGEIGLSGELRSVSQWERRVAEAERLGFKRCLLPEACLKRGTPSTSLELIAAGSLRDAARAVLS